MIHYHSCQNTHFNVALANCSNMNTPNEIQLRPDIPNVSITITIIVIVITILTITILTITILIIVRAWYPSRPPDGRHSVIDSLQPLYLAHTHLPYTLHYCAFIFPFYSVYFTTFSWTQSSPFSLGTHTLLVWPQTQNRWLLCVFDTQAAEHAWFWGWHHNICLHHNICWNQYKRVTT